MNKKTFIVFVIVLSLFSVPLVSSAVTVSDEYKNIKAVVYFEPTAQSDQAGFLADNIQSIRNAGFNTVFLTHGWSQYESKVNPPVYRDAGFTELKAQLDLLKANNMKALIGINPGSAPVGIDPYTWIDSPEQYNAYKEYVTYFLKQILPYKDMVYIFVLTENSIPYDVIMKDPNGTAKKLRATLGNIPNQIPQDLRKNFKIGYHDNEFIPLGLIKSISNSPIASPNPFDFVSITTYPVLSGYEFPTDTNGQLTQKQITSTLDTRIGYMKTLYPQIPMIIGEVGYPSCITNGGESQQNMVLNSMLSYFVEKGYGFSLWSWPADLLPFALTQPCSELSYGLLRPDGSAKPSLDSVTNLLNPTGKKNAATVIPSTVKVSQNNAAFVSQNVPTSMVPGKTYTVSYTFKNIGSTTWKKGDFSKNEMYRLGSVINTGTDWGNRIDFSYGEIIPPGGQKTFSFTVTAPTTPGTYFMTWRMVLEGVEWFGKYAPVSQIEVAYPLALNAEVVSQSVPFSVISGDYLDATIVLKNTGNTTWTNSGQTYEFQLGSINPQKNTIWEGSALTLYKDVAPGEQIPFVFHVKTPTSAGVYNFQWQMLRNVGSVSTYFGKPSANSSVLVVVPKAIDAQFISQIVPTTVFAGGYLDATVIFKNIGTTTWTNSGQTYEFQLGSINPRKNTIWEGNALTLYKNVFRGEQVPFVFHVKAPTTAGVYNFQWQMLRNTASGPQYFGDTTASTTIRVQ